MKRRPFSAGVRGEWRKQLKIFHKSADIAAIQLELIDLQQNDELKNSFKTMDSKFFIGTYLQRI